MHETLRGWRSTAFVSASDVPEASAASSVCFASSAHTERLLTDLAVLPDHKAILSRGCRAVQRVLRPTSAQESETREQPPEPG